MQEKCYSQSCLLLLFTTREQEPAGESDKGYDEDSDADDDINLFDEIDELFDEKNDDGYDD